jgi:hypothetical protein
MWYMFFGLFHSPTHLRSVWDKLQENNIEKNALYVDMITYWFCNSDFIWQSVCNETEISMNVYMILSKLNTTSVGNIAYLALHLKNLEHRKHVQKLYNSIIKFKENFIMNE